MEKILEAEKNRVRAEALHGAGSRPMTRKSFKEGISPIPFTEWLYDGESGTIVGPDGTPDAEANVFLLGWSAGRPLSVENVSYFFRDLRGFTLRDK